VLVSSMEHHSNDLPWRKFANVVFIDINKDGTLNLTDLKNKVEKYSGKLRVIAVTGAANVTGLVNPIYEIAELAHSHNAMIAVDAAQLAPHRAIDVKPNDHPQHIDFLIISAHKLYAPYGTGALIGPKKIFESGEPEYVGGGTISIVTHEQVNWAELPDKEEAGTPNLLGAVALAKSLQILNSIGMENVAEHEIELTDYILKKVKHIDEFKLLGPKEFNDLRNKLGVITFNLEGFHNSLVSSILCYEFGIGVRSGCFCAHPYIKELLGVTKEESDLMIKNILSGDRSDLPGAVRASFGLYNTTEEIDEFLEAIQKIIRKEYKGNYILNRRKGYYAPEKFSPNIESYFKL
ncbi:MAG: aminotransferase class V-fold PLP-dependent enzyme, partial [Ignavibacteria bacterium]|nr:aminotransferase class V-fold PLP-dependent enzyme [Ignavibacteria bacterium]